jgi:hypothetical protein
MDGKIMINWLIKFIMSNSNIGVAATQELAKHRLHTTKRKFKVYPSAYANAWLVRTYKKRGGTY